MYGSVRRRARKIKDVYPSLKNRGKANFAQFGACDKKMLPRVRPPKTSEKKIRVGIVGEIFVKFSPLGNTHLEDFLISEGAETRMAGLMDFCLYCIQNGINDMAMYGHKTAFNRACKYLLPLVEKIQRDMINAIKTNSMFEGCSNLKDILF